MKATRFPYAWMASAALLCALIPTHDQQLAAQENMEPVRMWVLNGSAESDYRERIVDMGNRKLAELNQVLTRKQQPLTPEQDAKLKLAIEGVASRFMHEVTHMKAMTEGLQINNPNDAQKAIQIVQPAMQKAQDGWFGKDSLYERTIDKTLDGQQQAAMTMHREDVRRRRDHALAQRVVAELSDRLLLVQDQREKLLQLIDQQDKIRVHANTESYLAYVKIAQIDRKDLETFLDAEQITTLKKLTDQFKNMRLVAP